MRRVSLLALLAFMTVACSSRHSVPAASAYTPPADRTAARGLEFAQAHCSGCHAVVPLSISVDPEAPPFESIVNAQGLTLDTLRTFLRDSHNFPDIMKFDVDPDQIDALAVYMLTLRETE
ncbi:MAG: cytochrome c [Novosphingobium sp.]|nr:cytochrome c [Novosphingobium sp.]MCP5403460.1 cytochrome c [Novosphingobium sp.]